MSMRFQYILHEAGWATAIISCAGQSVEMRASYLHDALDDLASATIAIVNGAHEVTVTFMDEPGEHQLVIRREAESNVALQVRWHDDWHNPGMGISDYNVLLSCVTRLAHLRGQVLSALNRILEEHGEVGYKERWGNHEFPLEQLRKLQASQQPVEAAPRVAFLS